MAPASSKLHFSSAINEHFPTANANSVGSLADDEESRSSATDTTEDQCRQLVRFMCTLNREDSQRTEKMDVDPPVEEQMKTTTGGFFGGDQGDRLMAEIEAVDELPPPPAEDDEGEEEEVKPEVRVPFGRNRRERRPRERPAFPEFKPAISAGPSGARAISADSSEDFKPNVSAQKPAARSGRLRVSATPPVGEDSGRMRPPSERAKRMEEKKAERERREIEAMKQEEEEREVRRQRRAKQLGRLENSSTTHDDSHDSMDDVKDERFDVIEIDDEAPAHHHPKAEPVDPTAPREVYFICFFCGSVLDDPSDFVNHMEHHLEHFDRCPICVAQGKPQTLKHSLHLIDHLLEMHMRSQDDRIECPTCRLSFGDMRFRENFYLGFKHVLFDCSALGFCTICLAAKDGQKIRLPENSKKHFNWAHPHIYNRFLCTSCLMGFPTRIGFFGHECSLTIRCNCDLTASFRSVEEYFQHRRLGQKDHCQMLQKMSHDTPAIFVPGELRKTLEAARVAAWKARGERKVPTRADMLAFLLKYPILRLFKEDLPEDVHSQPPFRRTLPVNGPRARDGRGHERSEEQSAARLASQIARKYASGGRSISPAVPEVKPAVTHATQSAVVQKAPLKEPSFSGSRPPPRISVPQLRPGESQTADEKALAARSKAKRKRGADEQPKPKVIKLQEAHAERSDVWKWAEKLDGDLEVAACLEDLVFSVADPSIVAANGIGRELTIKAREPRRVPVQPPAAPVAISSSALPLPKKIVLKLAPRPAAPQHAPAAPAVFAPQIRAFPQNFILRKFAAVPPNAHARPEANGMRVQPPPPIVRRSPSEEDDEIQVVGVRPAPHPVDVIYVE